MNKQINENLKKLKECINTLRNYNDEGLEQFINENESLSFPKELTATGKEFTSILRFLSKTLPDSSFLDEYHNASEDEFWELVKWYVDNRIKTSQELSFVRELSDDCFYEIFDYILKNFILEYNSISKHKDFNEQQIRIMIKALNTFVKMIIGDFYSKKRFSSATDDLFGLSENQINYLWDLINNNKNDLTYIMIMNRLERLENKNK